MHALISYSSRDPPCRHVRRIVNKTVSKTKASQEVSSKDLPLLELLGGRMSKNEALGTVPVDLGQASVSCRV